jgi:pyrimidine operon attenuation protein/uracil phosphoribosyltransferase
LALALRSIGVAGSVWTGVSRVHAVRKSATALNVDRPSVKQHYDSFAITTECQNSAGPQRIILVDDVITKGRTLYAAALRLHEALPGADIRAFALVRTMGFLSNITHSLDPCHGVIRWAAGEVYREP